MTKPQKSETFKEQIKGIVSVAQDANATTPSPQNVNAPKPGPQNAAVPAPGAQSANTPKPGSQGASAPKPAPHSAAAPKPGHQNADATPPSPARPDEMHELPARHSSARPLHDPAGDPEPAVGTSGDPSRRTTESALVMRRARSWLIRLVSSTFVRFLLIFLIGVVTTLTWQSYSDAGREAVADWCRSIAPQPAPVTQSISPSPVAQTVSPSAASAAAQNVSSSAAAQTASSSPEDRNPVSQDPLKATSDLLKAMSLALAAAREGVDKLAAELTKPQTIDHGAADRASLASGVPPASRPPSPPSRAPSPH